MNKETIKQVSFSVDLLNLSRKLGCHGASGSETADAIAELEDALQAAGVREPVKKTK